MERWSTRYHHGGVYANVGSEKKRKNHHATKSKQDGGKGKKPGSDPFHFSFNFHAAAAGSLVKHRILRPQKEVPRHLLCYLKGEKEGKKVPRERASYGYG